ncbi:MAG: hypothetical protein FWC09_02645 [Lachnospiraceae bacterium]|nr:hypothetical protein [Lachnospiraceae bacterium]
MQKIINKSTAIRYIIAIIGTCLIISLFPLRIWPQAITTVIPRTSNEVIGAVTQEHMALQSFIAAYDYLDSFRIFLSSGTQGDAFYFRMLAPDNRLIFEEVVRINHNNIPGYYEILADQSLIPGETYHYIIQAVNENTFIYLGAEWVSRNDYPNIGALYFEEYPMSGQNLAADYRYIVPLQKGYSLILIAVVLLLTCLSLFAVNKYYHKRPERDSLMIVEQAVKVVLNPLVAILIVIGLVSVFFKTYGSYWLDNIFFAAAILLFGGVCLYGINHNRNGQDAIITKKIFSENWLDYAQSIAFAFAIYACCLYMNAEHSLHQSIAQNKQIIYLGIVILLMMKPKQIFSYLNLICLTVAVGLGYYYYTEQIRAGMGELSELDVTNIGLTTGVYVIGAIVIINVIVNFIIRLVKKEIKPISIFFGILIALFFVLIIVFRNTRVWPITLVICSTLYYLQYGASRKSDIVLNICRGIILSFLWMVGASLLYRPFATFATVRFPMIFHTVTVTATYLALVSATALLILLTKMRRMQTKFGSVYLKDIWKECILLGTALTYLTFTISNTGVYTFIIVAFCSLLVFSYGKAKVKNILKTAGIIFLSLMVCFPIVFFMQRNIPIFVGKPKDFLFKPYHQDIVRGRNPASFEHMRVGRFIEVFAEEFFGIPSERFDFYGFTKQNEEAVVMIDEQIISLDEVKKMGIGGTKTLAETKQEVLDEWDTLDEDLKEYWHNVLNITNEEPVDFSNGRLDIYRAYLNQLNATGHNIMGATMPDGTLEVHAHNIYLQFAFDHGIYMGILFIIVGGAAFVRGVIYYRKNRDTETIAGLPMVIIKTVATAGLAEWIFHFSNPSGFVLLLVLAPLIFDSPDVNIVKRKGYM